MNYANPEKPSQLAGLLFFIVAIAISVGGCATQSYYSAAPNMPVTVAPAHAETISNGTAVRFEWLEANDTEHYEFHIFNRATGGISDYYRSALNPATICRDGTCSLTLTLNLPDDKGHAWRVRAKNMAGDSTWTRTLFEIVR